MRHKILTHQSIHIGTYEELILYQGKPAIQWKSVNWMSLNETPNRVMSFTKRGLLPFFMVPEPHLTFGSQLMFSLISAVFRQPSGVVSNEMIGVRIRIYITRMELDLIMI